MAARQGATRATRRIYIECSRRLHIDEAPEIIYYDAGFKTDHPFWQAAARREWRVADPLAGVANSSGNVQQETDGRLVPAWYTCSVNIQDVMCKHGRSLLCPYV